MGFCCGFVAGTDKHQLWCARHPDRLRKAGQEAEALPAPPPNKPEPRGAADRIAQQCASLLDADKWDTLDKHWITIRGVKLWIANQAESVHIRTDADAPQLSEVYPHTDYRHIFWESYTSFLGRERERRAATVERELRRKLEPPTPEPVPEHKSRIERLMNWLAGAT